MTTGESHCAIAERAQYDRFLAISDNKRQITHKVLQAALRLRPDMFIDLDFKLKDFELDRGVASPSPMVFSDVDVPFFFIFFIFFLYQLPGCRFVVV